MRSPLPTSRQIGALGALTSSSPTLPSDFVAKVANGGPYATHLQLQQAVSASPLAFPVKAEYCPTCGLDVFTHPDARVTALTTPPDPLDAEVEVTCECGQHIFLPAYLFQ